MKLYNIKFVSYELKQSHYAKWKFVSAACCRVILVSSHRIQGATSFGLAQIELSTVLHFMGVGTRGTWTLIMDPPEFRKRWKKPERIFHRLLSELYCVISSIIHWTKVYIWHRQFLSYSTSVDSEVPNLPAFAYPEGSLTDNYSG